jgi:hypothetical protein
MEVQTEPLKEILAELFALLEAQETHSAAVLQFLNDQGIATDEKLAPYLEKAGRASNVKWLAARKRMEYLLTPIQKETTEKDKAQESGQGKNGQKDKNKDREKGEPAEALAHGPVQQEAANERQNGDTRTEKKEDGKTSAESKTAKT